MRDLNKSIDALIDEFFTEEESEVIEKSIDIKNDSKTTADEVVNSAPKSVKDKRPVKAIQDVPEEDEDGARSKEYDSAISEKGKEEDVEEVSQVKEPKNFKKSDSDGVHKIQVVNPSKAQAELSNKHKILSKPVGDEIHVKHEDSKPLHAWMLNSGWDAKDIKGTYPEVHRMANGMKKSIEQDEDYADFLAFKKSKEVRKEEELKKAESEKMESLIKSVVAKTSAKYESKIEELSKALQEQSTLVKAMARQPQSSKSITSVEALTKSVHEEETSGGFFSKSEMLDAAEELMKKGGLTVDHVIELENGGFIYDPQARKNLENYLSKRK